MEHTWRIERYKTAQGDSPVDEFILSLLPAEVGRLKARLDYLALDGVNAGTHIVRAVRGGVRSQGRSKLWELRMPKSQNNPRFLFCLLHGQTILLLHGFAKTGNPDDRLPNKEVEIAVKRMNEFLERRGKR